MADDLSEAAANLTEGLVLFRAAGVTQSMDEVSLTLSLQYLAQHLTRESR